VLSKGAFTQVDVPDADGYTTVNGINANGERVGIYLKDGRFHGYFWSKGAFTTLDRPGWTFSQAFFLNSHGQVVGYYVDAATRTRHGFVWVTAQRVSTRLS